MRDFFAAIQSQSWQEIPLLDTQLFRSARSQSFEAITSEFEEQIELVFLLVRFRRIGSWPLRCRLAPASLLAKHAASWLATEQ